jgi:hypothetical protein
MVEYEDAREQKLLAAQIDRIKTSIDIGVLDPELMDSNAQRALTSYLLGSKASGAISSGQLGSGDTRVAGQLPGKQADAVLRGQSDKSQDVSRIVPDKSSASDWDLDDD